MKHQPRIGSILIQMGEGREMAPDVDSITLCTKHTSEQRKTCGGSGDAELPSRLTFVVSTVVGPLP